MKISIVEFIPSFYDRHWVYSLIPILRRHKADITWLSQPSVSQVAKANPDLVLYNCYQHHIDRAVKFDTLLKSIHACKSLVGGPAATFKSDFHIGTTINAACIGEGEVALDDYLESGLAKGRNISLNDGSSYESAMHINPDNHPHPDREYLYGVDRILRQSPFKSFMSGRGCPFDCTYCFNHAYNTEFANRGAIIRKKSVDYFIEEIRMIQKKYPMKLVSFQDDTFIIDKKWVIEFCDKYPSAIGIPFICNVRPNIVTDEVIGAIKQAGCISANWSIESGNERIRNGILKRNITDEQMQNTAELCKKHHLVYHTATIIGVPTESQENVEQTIEASIRYGSSFATANIFVPYAGLILTETAIKTGCLDHDFYKKIPPNFFTDSILNFPDSHKLFLKRTCYLMPALVKYPWLYYSRKARNILYKIPLIILRIVYEMSYLVAQKRDFGIRAPYSVSIAMVYRHILGLLKRK